LRAGECACRPFPAQGGFSMETIITKKLSFAMPIERAAQLYRVINGRNILPGDLESVTIEEAEKYIFAPTFEEFVRKNRIILVEGVSR